MIKVEGVLLTSGDIAVTSGSAILSIDTHCDATPDTVITLQGTFPGTFQVTASGDPYNPNTLYNDEAYTLISYITDTCGETLMGTGADDTHTGTSCDDTVNGGLRGDRLDGGVGNDTLRGGDGADTLDGGAGNDFLNGTAGGDILVFAGANGDDTVGGFEDGMDLIDLSRYAVDDVGDFVIVQVGTNTIIFGHDVGGGTIRLNGNNAGDIDDGDFIFV